DAVSREGARDVAGPLAELLLRLRDGKTALVVVEHFPEAPKPPLLLRALRAAGEPARALGLLDPEDRESALALLLEAGRLDDAAAVASAIAARPQGAYAGHVAAGEVLLARGNLPGS